MFDELPKFSHSSRHMRLKKRLSLAACLLAAAAPAQTPVPGARPLSLDDALQEALQNNLQLQIERLNPAIVQYELGDAYGYYDPILSASANRQNTTIPRQSFNPFTGLPNPASRTGQESYDAGLAGNAFLGMKYQLSGSLDDIRNTYFDNTANRVLATQQYPGDIGISVAQPLLKNMWIDSGRLSIKVSKLNVQVSEMGVKYRAMQVCNSIEQTYYDLVAARDQVRVAQKSVEYRTQFYNEYERRVAIGVLPPLEAKLAEAELARARSILITSQFRQTQVENQVKALISPDFSRIADTRLDPTDRLQVVPVVVNQIDSWSKGMTLRPDLVQHRIELEKRGINVRYARNQLFPTLDLRASYNLQGNGDDAWDRYQQYQDRSFPRDSLGVFFSMPLTRQSERNRFRGAKELVEQQLLILKQAEDIILENISTVISKVRSTYESVQANAKSVEYFQEALQAEEKKLTLGTSTSLNVLLVQSRLVEAESTLIGSQSEFLKSVAQLSFDEGSILERHRLSVEIKNDTRPRP